jgi:hypothetical protein
MDRRSNEQGHTSFWLPFVTLYQRRQILSPEAHFNAQVRACDADQDGVITEREAQVYWGQWFHFPEDLEWFGPPPGRGHSNDSGQGDRASGTGAVQKSD